MLFGRLLFSIIPHTVFSYHFYNPITSNILTLLSLENVPRGYKLVPPPKSYRKGIGRGPRNGYCSDAGFTCHTPFPKQSTFQFECDQDYQCPKNYKCCQQKCFLHKICSKTASTQINVNGNGNKNSNSCRPGSCEKWPYNCNKPYDYSSTSAFKCNDDRQCPKNFKCCEQNCFLHKICSKVATIVEIPIYGQKPSTSEPIITTPRRIEMVPEKTTESETEDYYDIDEAEYDDNGEENHDGIKSEETTHVPETTKIVEVAKTAEVSNPQAEDEDKALPEHSENKIQLTTSIPPSSTIVKSVDKENKTISRLTPTPDSNAIIPEYADYYYHYGSGNETFEDYIDGEVEAE